MNLPCENCIVLGICKGMINSIKENPHKAVVFINRCDLAGKYIFTNLLSNLKDPTPGVTSEEFGRYKQIIDFLQYERNKDGR